MAIKSKTMIAIPIVILVVLIVWGVLSAHTYISSCRGTANWPFDNATMLEYSNLNLQLYLDPSDRVFGYQRWARSNNVGIAVSERLPTGIGVSFGSSTAVAKKRLGYPRAISSFTPDLITYGYWTEKGQQILMDRGFLALEFHKEKLSRVFSQFREFQLDKGLRLGTTKSKVITTLVKPNVIRQNQKLITSVARSVPFPNVVPLSVWLVMGLLAAFLYRMIDKQDTSVPALLRLIIGAMIGALCYYLGLLTIAFAGDASALAHQLVSISTSVGVSIGVIYGVLSLVRNVRILKNTWIRALLLIILSSLATWLVTVLYAMNDQLAMSWLLMPFSAVFALTWIAWQYWLSMLPIWTTQ